MSRASKKAVVMDRPTSIFAILKAVLLSLIVVGSVAAFYAWSQHNHALAKVDLDTPASNILTNGSFEELDDTSKPKDWEITSTSPSVTYTSIDGHIGDKALRVSVDDYKMGLVNIEHVPTDLAAGKTYFFKSFYKTGVNFELLIRYTKADGSSKLVWQKHYNTVDDTWSTISTTVRLPDGYAKASIVLQVSQKGVLDLDGAYLIEHDDINIPAAPVTANIIPNADVQKIGAGGLPEGWVNYRTGANKTEFKRLVEGSNSYLHTEVTGYQNGEAKWQYQPLDVSAGQYFQFSTSYRSDTFVELVAEYETTTGAREFSQLATLPPTNGWTEFSMDFETVPNAKNVFVSLVLHRDGSVDSDNYSLHDISKSTGTFQKPLITITFDDGWQSQFDNAFPILKANGMHATYYLNSATIGKSGYMTKAEIETLMHDGSQLAAHGEDHYDMTTISSDSVGRQFTLINEFITKTSGNTNIDYASPFGKHDAVIDTLIQQKYLSHRGTETGVNTKQNLDLYNLKVLFIRPDSDVNEVQRLIDEAKAYNGWLILVYHQVDDLAGANTISKDLFASHMQTVKNSGIEVVTTRQAISSISK